MNHITPKISIRGRMTDGSPNPIDVHVGARIRLRRVILGLSQEMLGEALGLTFQQVQKYERGANRVSSSRLFDLSRVLDVPVGFFFDDMPDHVKAASPSAIRQGTAPESIRFHRRTDDESFHKGSVDLLRQFHSLTPDQQASIRRLVSAIANPMGGTNV